MKQATGGHDFNKWVTSSHRFTVMKTTSMVHHSQQGSILILLTLPSPSSRPLVSLVLPGSSSLLPGISVLGFPWLLLFFTQVCVQRLLLPEGTSKVVPQLPWSLCLQQQGHFACINLLSDSFTSSALEYEIYAFAVFRQHSKYLWQEGSDSSNFANRVCKSQRLHSSKSNYGMKVDLY